MRHLLFLFLSVFFLASCSNGGSANTNNNQKASSAADDTELITAGKKIAEQNGCLACHSTTGEKIVGPSFKGIYGSMVKVTTAGKERTITIDDDYIKTSIYEPDHDIPQGYVAGQMVSYKNTINDEQLKAVTAYIKSFK